MPKEPKNIKDYAQMAVSFANTLRADGFAAYEVEQVADLLKAEAGLWRNMLPRLSPEEVEQLGQRLAEKFSPILGKHQ